MTVTLTFALTLESDYHVSAGHGLAGEADSALLRDTDGVPVLRGTTLSGLMRDGLWRLLQLAPLKRYQQCQASGKPARDENEKPTPEYCGQFDPVAADCPICRLFGTPRQPKQWHIHSARPQNLVDVQSSPQAVAGTTVQRVRVDPATRRAEPHKLFSQEDGSQELTFIFTVTAPALNDSSLADAALIVAAARFVRQFGRSRRRGQGECLFSLAGVSGLATCPETGPEAQAFLLDHFEKAWLNGRSPTSSFVIPNYPTTFQSATDTRFLLVVRTEEPLLIARRAEAGNQFEGVSIIPGIVVKGAFAWLAVRRYGLSRYHKQADVQTLPAYKDFNQVFRRGGVQFPYLYPARYAERQLFPAIPAPLDLLTCKLFPGFTSQRMHGVFPAGNTDCPTCGEHLQPLGGFVTLEGIRRLYQSELRYEMHIRINPESGRVRQGDLYSYVSIEAGQYFVGELESGDGQNWARFLELSGATVGEPFTLHLGKANRRGYGRVTAWLQPLPPIAGEPSLPLIWIQSGIQARVPAPDGTISLLFLTDTVLPDRWGRYPRSVASDSTWLSDWLGLPIEALDCFTQVKSVDGFNSHLGLPQWQDMAFAAGSVVHLKRPSATTWPTNWQDQLVNLEREGIGLRRDEGFGRIAFNHPIYQSDGTIGPSAIQLPESLALGGVTGEHSFTEDWQKKLDEQRKSLEKLCQGTPSAAVSRWLYANRTRSPNELQTQLSSLGVPDDTLIQAVGKAEYGARDKANRLIQKPERVQANDLTETERQKEGLGLLYTLLNELAAHSPVHWPNGISLLADAIANVNKDQEVTK